MAEASKTPASERKLYKVVKTFYDEGGRLVKAGAMYPWAVTADNPLPAVLVEAPAKPKASKED